MKKILAKIFGGAGGGVSAAVFLDTFLGAVVLAGVLVLGAIIHILGGFYLSAFSVIIYNGSQNKGY